MIGNLGKNRILWLLNGFLALVAAGIGVVNLDIYDGVVGNQVIPGVLSQDLLTILASILLLFLAFRAKEEAAREQIVILGILGYLFYAYGIYAIEQVYNSLYFVYLALFGLSVYSLIYGAASIRGEIKDQVKLPDPLRKLTVGFSLFVAIFFSFIWIMRLLPLLQSGDRIENFFSILILDLSFIMPAFAILAVMVAKRQGLGLLLTPALYVLGATLLFPVGLGELFKPYFDMAIVPAEAALYLGVSAMFMVMTIVYLWKLKLPSDERETARLIRTQQAI